MDLFNQESNDRITKIGKTEVDYKSASSILNKATGFMGGYDYTLNPYSGCSFGCTYCYAAFFIRDNEKVDAWGRWVTVKDNALALLMKKQRNSLTGKSIYMSSVTDPYQPIEQKLEFTRELLTILARRHQPKIVIQTRSPLVTRDIDLLSEFRHVQVNMTITTDSESVRKVFEPDCPNLTVRLKAIQTVCEAGINSCITMTPLLPVQDVESFADKLLETGVDRFIIQPFHAEKGRFVAGTREAALSLLKQMDWNQKKFDLIYSKLAKRLPNLGYGRDGFSLK